MILRNCLAGLSIAIFLYSCYDKEQKTTVEENKITAQSFDTLAKSTSQNLNEPKPDSSVKNIDTATLACYISIVQKPYIAKIGKNYFSIADNNITSFLHSHKKDLKQQKLWLISSKNNSFKIVIDLLDEFVKNDITNYGELSL